MGLVVDILLSRVDRTDSLNAIVMKVASQCSHLKETIALNMNCGGVVVLGGVDRYEVLMVGLVEILSLSLVLLKWRCRI